MAKTNIKRLKNHDKYDTEYNSDNNNCFNNLCGC